MLIINTNLSQSKYGYIHNKYLYTFQKFTYNLEAKQVSSKVLLSQIKQKSIICKSLPKYGATFLIIRNNILKIKNEF